MKTPTDRISDILLTSHKLVERVLQADRSAANGREMYDNDYFDEFFEKVRPILEQRLAEASTATAALITSAWKEAGRPTVALVPARPVQKINRGK